MSPNFKGAIFALVAFALYATHDAIVKELGQFYSTFQILFFSVLFSFPLVMMMLMRDPMAGTLKPKHPWWMAFRTVSVLIVGVCIFYAFSVLPLAQVYSIIFTMPLLITVLAIPILKEKVGLHRWAAIAIGLIGVLVVIRPGAEPLSLGHIAALTGAVFGAMSSVIVRKVGAEERSAVVMVYPMMANWLVMGAVMPFFYEPMPIEHIGLIALMAVFAFTGGVCTIIAYRTADAAIVAPMQYSQIIWAAIFGVVFFNETASSRTWVGAGIIIASGVYIVIREAMGGRSENRPVLAERSRRPETGTTPRVTIVARILGRAQ